MRFDAPAAKELEFERAAQLRERIRELRAMKLFWQAAGL